MLFIGWAGQLATLAQTLPTSLDGLRLSEFVERLEDGQALRFYYPAGWDSLRISVPTSNLNLDQVLSRSLTGQSASYWISESGQVFLWNGGPINLRFPVAAPSLNREISDEEWEVLAHAEPITRAGPDRREEQQLGKDLGASRGVISGKVLDRATGTPIAGATVMVQALGQGTYTDDQGYFALSLPTGLRELTIRSYGMAEVIQPVRLLGDATLDIELEEEVKELEEVVIEAQRRQNVDDVQMGVDQITIAAIRQMPSLLGEVDVIRSALMLPGVQSVGEGAAGFNVRGGAVDQNLVLLQDAPVFNPNHLFGFFSAFHPDMVSDFKLYKSGIPAQYGGRISSIMEVGIKEGNRKRMELRGGISPIAGRLSVEGPLAGQKGSFVLGGRTTYSNWLLSRVPDAEVRNSQAYFGDLTLRATLEPNANNRIDLSAYISQDRFAFNGDTAFSYQNRSNSLSWKHFFSRQLYGVVTGIYSHYGYQVQSEGQPENAFELSYQLDHVEGKAELTWLRFSDHYLRAGVNAIRYDLRPGTMRPIRQESLISDIDVQRELALESGIYLSDEWRVNDRLSLYGGLRYSWFAALGSRTLLQYAPNAPRELDNVTDTLSYANGDILKTYQGPELRFSMRLNLDENSSIKASYNRMRQYIHRVSNTVSIAPTDIWKLSDPYIGPQIGDQYAVGYFRNLRRNTVEASVELYYKPIQNIIDYKGGADLLLNEHVETELLSGIGRAYGVELLIKKPSGRLNGWIGYTYSRTFIRVNGEFPEDRVNNGAYFPANYDKPHDFTTVINYKVSRRVSFSGNVTYSTGRPITLPVAQYNYAGSARVFYSDRNAYRVPDYFRVDAALNLEGSHRLKKLAHSSWSLSVYNLLGRNNVYSIYFVSSMSRVNGYQLSIFSKPILTITYNFRL